MSQNIRINRTATPAKAPTSLMFGELSVNVVDKTLFVGDNTGGIVQLNHATNITTDATHRFVSDAQIEQWNLGEGVASKTEAGIVQIGDNIDVTEGGVISVKIADGVNAGLLSPEDYDVFVGKQDALGFTPVNRAGDTMTGPLALSGAPTADAQAANKKYVDDSAATKLNKSGGTMTGILTLSGDPVAGLDAATRQYVDNKVSLISGEYASAVQTIALLSEITSSNRQDKQLRLVEDEGAIYRFDFESSAVADGTDVIIPDDVPATGRWFKVMSATQAHNQLKGLQGGAPGDYNHLTTAEKNSYDAHISNTNSHLTTDQQNLLSGISVTGAEINSLAGIDSNVQDQLDSKQANLGYVPVNRAGDTMTGMLKMSGDATDAMHPVTLQQLQAFVIDGGEY